jgi:hypothetical protein
MTRSSEAMKGWFVFAAGIGAFPLTFLVERLSHFSTLGVFVAGELFRGRIGGAGSMLLTMMTIVGIDYFFWFAVIFGACLLGAKVWRRGNRISR